MYFGNCFFLFFSFNKQSLWFTPIQTPTNVWLLVHLEFKVATSGNVPASSPNFVSLWCVSLFGVMCELRMTDRNPDFHPLLQCPDDTLTELFCCRVLGATEMECRGLVRLLGALWRGYTGGWWLFLTVVMGALDYLLHTWMRKQIFDSIFLSSKSHDWAWGVSNYHILY